MRAMTSEYQDDKGGGIASGTGQDGDGRGKRPSYPVSWGCCSECHAVEARRGDELEKSREYCQALMLIEFNSSNAYDTNSHFMLSCSESSSFRYLNSTEMCLAEKSNHGYPHDEVG